MSRITVITPYFHPEVISCVPLMTSLTEDLVAAGHEVEVLTSAPVQWDDGERVAAHAGREVPVRDRYAGARVVRLRNLFPRSRGALSKLLEYAWFSLWICARLLLTRRADVIYIYSNPPLLGLPVSWLAHLRGTRVLYNLQDIFPDSAVSGGLLPATSRALRFLRVLERWTYRAVDRVAVISDDFAAHVRRVAPRADVEVLPNWVDTDALRPIPDEANRFLPRLDAGGKFIVLYSGNLGFLHGIGTLLDAAALLQDLPEIVFVIVGEGQQREEMIDYARKRGIDNVRFVDYQPFSLVAHVYSAGDVCVVPMRRGAAGSAIPSKTWSIMACGRPVLAAIDLDSELAELVARAGAGVVTEAEDAAALAAAIRRLAADPERGEEMGANGRRFVEENLSRTRITRRYVESLESLTRSRLPGHGRKTTHPGAEHHGSERIPSRRS